MKNIRLIAFCIIALAYIVSRLAAYETLAFITKPLLMPALAVWLAYETSERPARFLRREVLAGLVFATAGDTLLLFDGPLFFMLGLAAFLFTHISYIGGFWAVADIRKGFLRMQAAWVLPFAVFLVCFLWWLWPGIPAGMRLPVSLYSTIISIMVLSIINLKGRISDGIFWPMLAGGLLFMLSDTILAAGKFGHVAWETGLAIIITYIAGQFLIAKSARDILKA